ncbi:MAG: hypothetical protein MJY59_05480 [Bacteroidaceae bacterium]|nr:hypothetical protein [Bacteroidaceae bacterium]
MVKTKLLILSLLTLVSTSLWGQNWVDVTSTYLTNADFEGSYSEKSGTGVTSERAIYEPNGWTVTYKSGDKNDMTILNSGDKQSGSFNSITKLATGGNNTYLYRGKWGNNTNITVAQNVELPKGKYRLSCDAWKSGLGGDGSILAGGKTAALSGNEANWRSLSLEFTVTATGTTQIGFNIIHNSDGSEKFIGFDNFKLEFDDTPDKTSLGSTIAVAEGLYSPTGKDAEIFRAAINAAKEVYENAAAKTSEVYDADAALKDAIFAYKLANASPENPLDVTDLIGSIASSTANWNMTTGAQNKVYKTSTEKNNGEYVAAGFIENWNGSNFKGEISYVITGLPAGKYRISAYAFDSNKSGSVYFFANDQETVLDSSTDKFSNPTIDGIFIDENSELKVGLNIKEANTNWVGIANVKLVYLGYDVTAALANLQALVESATFSEKHSAKSEEALQNAIDAANNLINNPDTATKNTIATASANLTEAMAAVTASIADYANLSQQIAMAEKYTVLVNADSYETAIQAAKDTYESGSAVTCAETIKSLTDFKVADFTYASDTYKYGVALGEWTTTGYVKDFDNEHWSGKKVKYKNQDDDNGRGWNSSTGFTIGLNQDLKLPAGKYVFKACGRKSEGATLELVVKVKDGDVIGRVSDFPVGSAARGIDTLGIASFDDVNEMYANNGKGFGWQWRFVEFELTEGTTINVAVAANATTKYQWASFGDYSIMTDDEANIAMIAYNIALNDANLALAADAYKNVTGQERTDLQTAIAASPGSDKEAIESATKNLKSVTDTFKAAAVAYDDFAKAKDEAGTYSEELPYANPSKKEAIATAVAVTPTSAETATAAAAAVRAAYRAYIESNAMAEGVEGAVDKTNLVKNPNFAENLDGWTSSQSGGNLSRKDTTAEPLTAADGSKFCYYDYYNSNSNNQHAQQTINNLPAGIYIFSVSARADVNLNPVYLWATGAENVSVNQIGSTGGAFGRGWNDYTVEITNPKTQDVTVGVKTDPTNGNKGGWFGFTRARLVKLQDGAVMNITDVKYATFVAPFDVTIPDGVTASTVTSLTGTTLNLQALETTIPANTPVILNSETALSQTFYGKAVEGEPVAGLLTGVYEDTEIESGYVLVKRDGIAKFAVVDGEAATVPANRAYLTVESSVKEFSLEQATGISTVVPMSDNLNEPVFNLAGQRVGKDYQGIIIKNGKKQLNK